MTRLAAEEMTGWLLRHHGLEGWRVEWSGKRRVAGTCRRKDRVVTLSWPIVEVNGERAVREIILHEIAHALTSGGHTAMWRMVAKAIGGTGSRAVPEWVKMPVGVKRLRCRVCMAEVEVYRKLKRRHSCMSCGGPRFNSDYVLEEVDCDAGAGEGEGARGSDGVRPVHAG